MKRLICMLFVMALALSPVVAEAYTFDIAVGYWSPEPTGGFSYSLGATVNESLDLADDLGLEKEGQTQVKAKVDLPLLNVALMTTPLSFEGTGVMTQDITFGGTTYTTSEQMTSRIDMSHTDVALFWAVPGLKLATVNMLNVEFGLNARMLDAEATVTGATLGTETKTLSATIPMLYLGVQFTPTDSLGVDVEYRGLSVGDNSYTDMMAMIKWSPVPLFYISGGFRTETLELDEEGILTDVEFKGPFAELGLKF